MATKDFGIISTDSQLTKNMVLDKRQYYIDKVKQPLILALVRVTGVASKIALFFAAWQIVRTITKYPEPTRQNCNKGLTLALMNIWDTFFYFEDNPVHPDPKLHPFFGRDQLFKAIRRVMLSTVEHDRYYRERIHWFIEEVAKSYLDGTIPSQTPMEPNRKVSWKEPMDKEEIRSFLMWRFQEEKNESNSSRQVEQRQ